MPVFFCYHCGHQIVADQGYAGMMAPCPGCGKRVPVPNEANAPATSPVQVPPPSFLTSRPHTPSPSSLTLRPTAPPPPATILPPAPPVVAPPPLPPLPKQPPPPPAPPVPRQAYIATARPRVALSSDRRPIMPEQAPGAGCAHYVFVLLATGVALLCGFLVVYPLLQEEFAAHPEAHVPHEKVLEVSRYFGGYIAGALSVVSIVISVFVAALMVGIFKRRFWRSLLASFSFFTILFSVGFGLLIWKMWGTPEFRKMQQDARERMAAQREARRNTAPAPDTPSSPSVPNTPSSSPAR